MSLRTGTPLDILGQYLASFDASAFAPPPTPETTGWLEDAYGLVLAAARQSGLTRKLTAGTLSDVDARGLVGTLVSTSARSLRALTDGLLTAKSRVARWHEAMRAAVPPVHVAAGVAVSGSLDPPPSFTGRLVAEARTQLHYLADFAADVSAGRKPIGAGASNRASLYARGAWATAQNALRWLRQRAYAFERRLLGPVATEHCHDCLVQAALGWQPAGVLLPIGESECLVWCRCHFVYSRTRRGS